MQGKIDARANITLRWNLQETKLYSPDGLHHCLPCECCGQPTWVGLLTVSVLCDICAYSPEPVELDDRLIAN